MNNYLIEGNVDFYKELSKIMAEESQDAPLENSGNSENSETQSKKYCLITNELLTDNSITLECSHSFNYIPLFHDIQNQKKKFNSMERYSLKTKQIRCPYCRNIQQTLLPYYEMEGVTKIHGVNFYNEGEALVEEYRQNNYNSNEYVKGICGFFYISKDQEGNVVENNCTNKYVKVLSFDNKCYCVQHRLTVLKNYMALKKQKEKEDAKKAKDLAKQKAKEEKMEKKKLAKELKKQENIICQEILKTGKNKGKTCCQKVSENSTLCSRHSNLQLKKNLQVV
jgi:hypothetical protein